MCAENPHFPGGLTVLMSVYKHDKPNLLRQAIVSAFENTLVPDSLVLVIDGEIPVEIEEVIESVQHSYRIKLVRLRTNSGLAKALNAGLRVVDTEWVARADADDYNKPERFKKQAIALAESGNCLDIIGSSIEEIEDDGSVVAIRRTKIHHDLILDYLTKRSPFNHATVVFKKSKVLACGGYPEIYLKEDYALWASLLAQGSRAINLDEALVVVSGGRSMYRRRGGWKYAKAEIELQRHLIRLGVKGKLRGVFDGIIRGGVSVLPSLVREMVYLKFLRDKPVVRTQFL